MEDDSTVSVIFISISSTLYIYTCCLCVQAGQNEVSDMSTPMKSSQMSSSVSGEDVFQGKETKVRGSDRVLNILSVDVCSVSEIISILVIVRRLCYRCCTPECEYLLHNNNFVQKYLSSSISISNFHHTLEGTILLIILELFYQKIWQSSD